MQRITTGRQAQAWKIIQPRLYRRGRYAMIDFKGTRSDYKVPMIFLSVTPSGNIRVKEITGEKPSGPTQFRTRIAQLKQSSEGPYWWIEDGTGSMVLRPNRH